MKSKNLIYSVGPNGKLVVNPEQVSNISAICDALKSAVGENASWRLWQYRLGSIAHTALDIEGTKGEVNWTIIASEKLELPVLDEICFGREPISHVNDSVDAFYLAEALITAIR